MLRLLLLLFTITIYGFDLLMLLAYAPSMPPLFSLPLSMACDDSNGCHEKPALHAFKAAIFPFNIKLFRLAVISLNDLDKVTLSICIVAGLLLLLFTITIYGFDLLMLLAYDPSMPPLFSLPLSMACDDSSVEAEIVRNLVGKPISFDDWRFAAGHVVRVHGYGGKANPIGYTHLYVRIWVSSHHNEGTIHIAIIWKSLWENLQKVEASIRIGLNDGVAMLETHEYVVHTSRIILIGSKPTRELYTLAFLYYNFLPSSTQRDHGAWTQHWWWKGFTLATSLEAKTQTRNWRYRDRG
ncbi:hypothetical protein Tco_0729886 [Tanacetum coccineum]|uniref:Uncharacterized protein n=1 Tax=Tanacetum coccineum TaxID=301880 RepID=A0ABQ4YSN2_9ASTR